MAAAVRPAGGAVTYSLWFYRKCWFMMSYFPKNKITSVHKVSFLQIKLHLAANDEYRCSHLDRWVCHRETQDVPVSLKIGTALEIYSCATVWAWDCQNKWRGRSGQQTWFTIPEMISDNLLEGTRNDAEEHCRREGWVQVTV